eukprot:Pompholyxophrys_punicea_v1_NODE_1060_length_1000_cov_5.766138.p1 type:complete len:109 gc:universal NODE_1060_length_1000_cov_5.766138:211-537(+)
MSTLGKTLLKFTAAKNFRVLNTNLLPKKSTKLKSGTRNSNDGDEPDDLDLEESPQKRHVKCSDSFNKTLIVHTGVIKAETTIARAEAAIELYLLATSTHLFVVFHAAT